MEKLPPCRTKDASQEFVAAAAPQNIDLIRSLMLLIILDCQQSEVLIYLGILFSFRNLHVTFSTRNINFITI